MENITLTQQRDITRVRSFGGRQELIPGITKYTCTCASTIELSIPATCHTWKSVQNGSSLAYKFNCEIHPLYTTSKIIVYKCKEFVMHNKGVVTSEDTLQKLLSISDIDLEEALTITKLQSQLEVQL